MVRASMRDHANLPRTISIRKTYLALFFPVTKKDTRDVDAGTVSPFAIAASDSEIEAGAAAMDEQRVDHMVRHLENVHTQYADVSKRLSISLSESKDLREERDNLSNEKSKLELDLIDAQKSYVTREKAVLEDLEREKSELNENIPSIPAPSLSLSLSTLTHNTQFEAQSLQRKSSACGGLRKNVLGQSKKVHNLANSNL